MLFRLALRNIKRNWYRTLLALLGMALAAGSLTGAVSMTTGYPTGAYEVYRQFMQGDLVVYPGRLSLEGSRLEVGTHETEWRWTTYDRSQFSDLSFFHPEMVEEGFLMPEDDQGLVLSRKELQRLAADTPGVKAVNPYLVYPGFLHFEGKELPAPLRGRSPGADKALDFSELVVSGRYFDDEDRGKLVVLINSARPTTSDIFGSRQTHRPPRVGTWVTVELPTVRTWRRGLPVFDYEKRRRELFRVIGHYELPTHEIAVKREVNPQGPFKPVHLEQAYWETPQLLVPEETLRQLYSELGAGVPKGYMQAGVQVDNMFRARQVAAEVRERFPNWTVFAVPEQVKRSFSAQHQTAVPDDLSRIIGIAAVAAAGLIVAANMYVLVVQRRRELGIYRAIGMSSRELILLVLLETLAVGVVGGLLGFVPVRLLVSGMLYLSDATLLEALRLTLSAAGTVLGLTVGCSLLFGLFPAWMAARSTTMEVLRYDA